MSEIQKVTIVFDDKVMELEGEEVKKWSEHNKTVASVAAAHNCNPFDTDKINWKVTHKWIS